MTDGTNTLHFYYDASGVMGVNYNGTDYFYLKNIQGDVIAIVNSSGTVVAEYTYDAWGNPLSTTGSMASTLGAVNPLRYHSYVYDTETGLYYLQSRYYSPRICRFVNTDNIISGMGNSVQGANVFAYCLNNPVNMVDHLGNKPGDLFRSMDAAAKDAAIYLGQFSFANGWEYGTSIYIKKSKHYTYYTTETYATPTPYGMRISSRRVANKGTINYYTYETVVTDSDSWGVIIKQPSNEPSRVAALHTHPMGSGKGITQFSNFSGKKENGAISDYTWAKDNRIYFYVHGPNGEMRRYNPFSGEDILVYQDLPLSPNTPWLAN